MTADDYGTIRDVLNGNIGNEIVGSTLSLHLINENRYFDIEFHSWTRDGNGGGYSYTRREVLQWLNVDETIVEGDLNTTAADASVMFDLDIDGSVMFEGDFVGTATISSNDPLEPVQVITVNVNVTGTPDITSTETTASTSVENGASITLEVPIINSGSGTLEVSNVVSDNSVLVPAETSFSVPPFSTYVVEATFSPMAVQTYDIDLTVTSDDPVSPSYVIDVTADGLDAPTFSITQTSFSQTLAAGSSTTVTFTIENTGDGTLNWNAGDETYFSKANYADPSLEENQDRIKADVWITRNEYEPIFNYFETDNYNSNSETIMYGDGQTNSLSFSDYTPDFQEATDNCGSCLEGNTLSLYLVDYDEYYDLDIDFWQSNESGGGVTYTRRLASQWLSLDSYSDELGTEGTSLVGVTFDATNLNAGMYTFSYDVLSNDPANPTTTLTFNLEVTGTPNLSITEGSDFSFSNVFVGETSDEGELSIRNTGTDVLNVTDITFDDAVFSASVTTATIQPDETVSIALSFAPGAEQAYNATGTITSDDGDSPHTFSVSGTGIAPPDVTVDVSTISAELLSGGTVEKSFTVTNNGTSSVGISIDKITVAGTDEVIFEKEDFADWTLEANQDRVSENLWITRGDRQGLFNAALETEYTSGERGERIAIVIEVPEIDPYDASPHGTLWANGRTSEAERYESWRNAIEGDAADLPGETLSMWDVEEDKYYDVEFLSWTSGGGCCGNPSQGGGFSYRRYEAVAWITDFTLPEGAIDGESSQEVTFDINAEGISAGEYEAVISISDGLNTDEITVSLTVLGLPEIVVEEDALDFESVFVGTEETLELGIENIGLANLEISSITTDNSAFTVSNVPSSIGIGESESVEVTFTPTETVSYTAVLTISSNDGTTSNYTVDLSGSGANPPVLSVDKTALDQTVFFGASASQTFTISNTGDADLEWNLGLSGGTVEFSRPDNVDWTLEENQDRIADDVWITRGSSRGIFNIAREEEFNRATDESPAGTLWGSGATGEVGDEGEGPYCFEELRMPRPIGGGYGNWRNIVGGNPSSDNIYSMHLTNQDLYYDVVFTYWAQGDDDGQGSTGGFTYERTPAFFEYDAVSFSVSEGVVEPGGSQEVTVFFNPNGTFDGRFELPLQVESNDPNGPAEIPLTLNVNGIIVENPIDDQIENEGFASTTINISDVFLDAQNDPLTYTVESSDGSVASATESGGTLTVTEAGIGTTAISILAEDGKGNEVLFEFDFRVNALPEVASAISDQSYDISFTTHDFNLNNVFSDEDEGDELTFSASSGDEDVATVEVNNGTLTVTEVSAGTADITVTANDGNGEVSDVFEVEINKLAQSITFTALGSVSEDVGTITLSATASSGLDVTYESSNASVATVSGNILTVLADGQTTITASQAGNEEYSPANDRTRTLTVERVLSTEDLEAVEIYPNPVDDYLTVTNEKATKISIYHLDGKLIISEDISGQVNLSKLDQGVYMIKLLDNQGEEIYSGRLLKN
ncbi:Ig-like domain-containing protein [Ekhidna sp.]